jgi:uncharacterized protein (TIGR00369 family)
MSQTLAIPEGYRLRESRSRYSREVGPFYFKYEDDLLWQGFWVEEKHLNGAEVVHGGMITTLADNLMAGAVYSKLKGRGLTIQMNVQFISAAKQGDWLEGWGKVVGMSHRFAFCESRLVVGDRVVAQATGVFKRSQQ